MSSLIKSSSYVPLEEYKKIAATYKKHTAPVQPPPSVEEEDVGSRDAMQELWVQENEQRLQEAEQAAEQLVAAAHAQAAELLEQAQLEAAAWWQQQREADEQLREQAEREGFEAGYEVGRESATAELQSRYESLIGEAQTLIEQAGDISRQMIADAESFLLELSTNIAGKLLGKQLTLTPDAALDMIRHALERCADKGMVTLCVAPSQFAYVHGAREELAGVLEARAELQILPDASVRDHGCVIKTSFGTIDARIETGLFEIKQALLDWQKRGSEEHDE